MPLGVVLVCLGVAVLAIANYGLGAVILLLFVLEFALLIGDVRAVRGLGRELEREGWTVGFLGLNPAPPSPSPPSAFASAIASETAEAPSRREPNSTAREERECPACAERVLVRATRCRFCGQALSPLAPQAPAEIKVQPEPAVVQTEEMSIAVPREWPLPGTGDTTTAVKSGSETPVTHPGQETATASLENVLLFASLAGFVIFAFFLLTR